MKNARGELFCGGIIKHSSTILHLEADVSNIGSLVTRVDSPETAISPKMWEIDGVSFGRV